MLRKMLFGCALATVVSAFSATPVFAQQPTNQLTYFTFSAPFELPGGKTLPAGKYTFKVADSPSNRHVVHIMSEDGTQMHATLLAIPAQRQEPSGEPEVRFMETAANEPPAVRTWWYPGRVIGHEFIYPREQARRLAARQKEDVLTVSSDAATSDAMQAANLSRINASGAEAPVMAEKMRGESQTTTAVTGTSAAPPTTAGATTARDSSATMTRQTPGAANTTAADRNAASASTETAPTRAARTQLPRTATLLPLIGLIGLASMAGAAALRLRRRR